MSERVMFDRFDDIREAMYHPDLSRGFDTRSFEEGNPRAGILSIQHGETHKQRRRLENPLFQRHVLVEYEQELFPVVLSDFCDRYAVGKADLFTLAGQLAVVLAAKRAGIDHDGSAEQLDELFAIVDSLAQASSILDQKGDKEQIQAEVRKTLVYFDEKYVTPSVRRREAMMDAHEKGEGPKPPYDLITVVLEETRAGNAPFDHGVLVREAGLYIHGGSYTNANTTCNTFYFLLGLDGNGRRDDLIQAVADDLLVAQKCGHETLRMRPTTPEIKRLVLTDTEIGGKKLPEGSTAVLNVRAGNRDPELFGPDTDEYNPFRRTDPQVNLWGLSFGAGPHICIGRSVAGGFPVDAKAQREGVRPNHLYGLVALMLQAFARRDPRLVEDDMPELDDRTTRGTRWSRFPVEFAKVPASVG